MTCLTPITLGTWMLFNPLWAWCAQGTPIEYASDVDLNASLLRGTVKSFVITVSCKQPTKLCCGLSVVELPIIRGIS